jgi:hypothetical protein
MDRGAIPEDGGGFVLQFTLRERPYLELMAD